MIAGHDVDEAMARFVKSLDGRRAPTIVVSNEVGAGLVPETALGRAFRDQSGLVNQQLAVSAHNVLFMVAGLAMPLKVLP
jgi:adenosylcobinamide kinase/adenosylcobinamide-phosphate guanylyltransferase